MFPIAIPVFARPHREITMFDSDSQYYEATWKTFMKQDAKGCAALTCGDVSTSWSCSRVNQICHDLSCTWDNDHCKASKATTPASWTTHRPRGRSARTVRVDGPRGRSARTVRTDGLRGWSVRTVRVDRPRGRSARTVLAETQKLHNWGAI